VLTSHKEEAMTIREELAKEIEDLPSETQEKVLRLIRVIKGETVMSRRRKAGAKRNNALVEVDEIAIETGIPDLASQHDHYLYGVPKR
jgi:predicted AlkP superfamily phosphohydrolase/phosphomutase